MAHGLLPPFHSMGRPPLSALAEEIRAHYSAYFGLPRSRLEVAAREGRGAGLEVYEFTPPRSGLRIFVTVGLSLLDHQRSVPELFFAVRRRGYEHDSAALRRALMTFWLAAHKAPELFVVGRLLRTLGGLPPPADRVVIAPALLLPEGAPKTKLSDGRTLWLGWLVPLHGWEAEYARRSGPVELLSLFQRSGIDPTIADRPSHVRTGDTLVDEVAPEPTEDAAEDPWSASTVIAAQPSLPQKLVPKPRGGLRTDAEDMQLGPWGRTVGI